MQENWIVESDNVLSEWVTKILVCNFKALNAVVHYSVDYDNEMLKKDPTAIGVWQIKTLKIN